MPDSVRSLEDHYQQSGPSLPSAPHQPEINQGQGGTFTRSQAAPWSRGHGTCSTQGMTCRQTGLNGAGTGSQHRSHLPASGLTSVQKHTQGVYSARSLRSHTWKVL